MKEILNLPLWTLVMYSSVVSTTLAQMTDAGGDTNAFPSPEVYSYGDAAACDECQPGGGIGTWYWMRSPEQERRVVMSLYGRYCVRCHGIDGRGIWDIPDVPDFTNARWQSSRSDDQLARLTLQGRGAVMPAFRGTLSLDEAWAMARYLRTFSQSPKTAEAPGLAVANQTMKQFPFQRASALFGPKNKSTSRSKPVLLPRIR